MTDENKNDDLEPEQTASGATENSADATGEAAGDEPAAPTAEHSTLEEEPVDAEHDLDIEQDTAPADDETALSEADEAILQQSAGDIVAEMRSDMLRAQAELVNFRQRVERDRAANRDAVIAEVLRSLLPALDDLSRAEKHGDLEGGPLEIVAKKIRSAFERYGLREVGEKGESFDPNFHEALVQLPTADVTEPTVADVIDVGYALNDRVIRAAKVAVSVPE
jgi:molecular chaperone GrpE